MPELKSKDQAVGKLREFVERVANSLLQFELAGGRDVECIAFAARSPNTNDPRIERT